MDQIYLDNNSTSRVLPEVAEAMHKCYLAGYANPASQHQLGQQARAYHEQTRDAIARLLGARCDGMHADRVIFTSGGTEANNLALRGLCGKPGSNILVSAIEHPSVWEVARFLQTQGYEVRTLPVSQSGIVQLDTLSGMIDERTALVSVMLGNNETGVLQPIDAISRICMDAGVALHSDAVQAVGKIPVNFHRLGVSALSLSGHKFHGPPGIGALLLRNDVSIDPILFGGFQQGGMRPGTEAITLACGLFSALEIWSQQAVTRERLLRTRRDHLETLLQSRIPSLVVNGAEADRLPHTSNISLPGLDRQAVLMTLDMAGVACSTGSACASGSSEPSRVLLAMGLDQAVVEGAIRISLSALTTEAEIDAAAARITRVFRSLRRGNSPRNEPPTARMPDDHKV